MLTRKLASIKKYFKSPKLRIKLIISVSFVLVIFILIGSVLIAYAERKLSNLVLGGLGECFPTKIYSGSFEMESGSRYSSSLLLERLSRLRYEKANQQAGKDITKY